MNISPSDKLQTLPTPFHIPRPSLAPVNHGESSILGNVASLSNTNTQYTLASNDTPAPDVKVKSVTFSNAVDYIGMSDGVDGKNEFPLSTIDRAYRDAMDIEAKRNGLLFAAGHDHYKTDPHEYNHALAVETMKGYESELP